MSESCFSVAAVGSTVTTAGSSSAVAIPVDASGATARAVLLSCPPGGSAHVRAGQSTVVATSNDLLVGDWGPTVFAVGGCSHIAYIEEVAGSKLNIAPIER